MEQSCKPIFALSVALEHRRTLVKVTRCIFMVDNGTKQPCYQIKGIQFNIMCGDESRYLLLSVPLRNIDLAPVRFSFQWLKVLASKLDGLSLSPRSCMVKGKNRLLKSVL